MYAHFVNKENLFALRSLLNGWDCFLNKYCNLLFLAICLSKFPILIFMSHSDVKKWKSPCERACEIKILWTKRPFEEKLINNHFKGLYKTICYKTCSVKSVRIRSFLVRIQSEYGKISEYGHFLYSDKV